RDREEHHREDQVLERPRRHHDDPLPRGARVELPVRVLGPDVHRRLPAGVVDEALERAGAAAAAQRLALGRRQHADHADVAAERDQLDAELRLADLARPQRLAEPDEELRDLDAELARRQVVAELVPGHREHDPGEQQQDPEHEHHDSPAPLGSAFLRDAASSPARARAHSSAASTSATVAGSAVQPSAASSTSSSTSKMPAKGSSPATNAATASSFAALNTAGTLPPAAPAALASRTPGSASSSSGSNVQLCAASQRQGGAAPVSRSGQPRASAIGSFMSGGLAWASVEPSVNVTIECTIDCGCTTTSTRS